MSAVADNTAIPAWQPATLEEVRLKDAHRSAFIYNRIRDTEGRLSDAEAGKVCGLTLQVSTRDHAAQEYENLYGPVELMS